MSTYNLIACYDLAISQNYFNENFQRVAYKYTLLNDRKFSTDIFVYTDYNNFKSDFSLSDIDNYDFKNTLKSDIYSAILDKFYNSIFDFDDDSKRLFSKKSNRLTKIELIELVECEWSYDYEEFLTETFKRNFEVVRVKGYSQGNYAEIIITNDYLKTCTIKDKENFLGGMTEYFQHLFYDAPIYIRLDDENNSDDIMLHEYLDDEYYYDKTELLSSLDKNLIHDDKNNIMQFLAESLPNELEYR